MYITARVVGLYLKLQKDRRALFLPNNNSSNVHILLCSDYFSAKKIANQVSQLKINFFHYSKLFTMKLKLGAIQILVTGLQPREMGAIYLMGTGIKEMPETVTKSALTNIIAFLCHQLDWIVNDEQENTELSTKTVAKNTESCEKASANASITTIKTPEEQNVDREVGGLHCTNKKTPTVGGASNLDTSTPKEMQSKSVEINIENYLDEVFEESKTHDTPSKISDTEAEKDIAASTESITIKTEPNEEIMICKDPSLKKPYNCTYCDKKFASRQNCKRHEIVHAGETFTCSECSKSFATLFSLKRHERSHNEEKPFMCSFCCKSFLDKRNLRSHETIHTGERPFTCSQCSKSFADPTRLKRHKMIHTEEKPFNCSICDHKFTRADSLKKHEVMHTNDRPFNCTQCCKRFKLKEKLKIHERKHVIEKTSINK